MRTVLDLFSAAAGGWSLGMHRAGFTTIAACEAVDWRRTLYAQNNPGIPIYDDVCTLTAERLVRDIGRLPDIVVGSPPCQDISSANTKGKGVEGERSGLFFEAVRLIGECRPRWFALENSANLRTRGADAVIVALEGIGYTCWPVVVRAGDIGANHERPRSWLIGCDLAQVTDPDGFGRDEGWGRRWSGIDLPISKDPRDAAEDGRRPGLPWGCAEPATWAQFAACGNDADTGQAEWRPNAHPGSNRDGEAGEWIEGAGGYAEPVEACDPDASDTSDAEPAGRDALGRRGGRPQGFGAIGTDGRDAGKQYPHEALRRQARHEYRDELRGQFLDEDDARNTPDPDQAGQADGCMVPGIRQEEITDDGCGDGRSADGSGVGQVAVCTDDSGGADGSWPLWSLDDLASRIRLDDGLPGALAGTRVAVGGPRGTSAASLIVEAYGDAVVPQIPEAIGRAILRTEAALSAIYARAA